MLHHVGGTSSFKTAERRTLVGFLEPYRGPSDFGQGRTPGEPNRWTGERDISAAAGHAQITASPGVCVPSTRRATFGLSTDSASSALPWCQPRIARPCRLTPASARRRARLATAPGLVGSRGDQHFALDKGIAPREENRAGGLGVVQHQHGRATRGDGASADGAEVEPARRERFEKLGEGSGVIGELDDKLLCWHAGDLFTRTVRAGVTLRPARRLQGWAAISVPALASRVSDARCMGGVAHE